MAHGRRGTYIRSHMPATLIHPRIVQIAAPFEGGAIVNCYLIDAPKRAIIDTGTASVPRASLLPALKEIGWQPSDLRIIINTHVHSDHAGGNADMVEASGAGIHIHRADAEMTDRTNRLYCAQEERRSATVGCSIALALEESLAVWQAIDDPVLGAQP